MRRVVAVLAAVAAFATIITATGVQGSLASWTDREWDAGDASTLDCATAGTGTSTATGRLIGGTLLGTDLDTVAEVHGVTVGNDGTTASPEPVTADEVVGSGGEAYQDALTVTALQSLHLETGNLLVLPLGTDTGVYAQYARADRVSGSAGASGLVTDSGGVDLGPFTAPEDERPEFATLRLGALLEQALGAPLATTLTAGVTDLNLGIGAVAAASALDGCAAAWGDDLYSALRRDYAIAGLGLDVQSPLVGGLVTAADSALNGVETAVAGLSDDTALLNSIASGVTGALSGVLGTVGVASPSATLAVTVDLTAARALLTGGIDDDAGILAIDLAAGTVNVDLAALFGAAYGTDGLNGRAPNSELLVDAAMLAALEDALTDAVADWVADLVAAVRAALDAAHVTSVVTLPLRVALVPVGTLTLSVSASLADLLDGDAVVASVVTGSCGLSCGLVAAVVDGLTPAVRDTIALAIGTPVTAALATIGTGFSTTLDTALDAPAAALLAMLDATLTGLFGLDGIVSLLVNAQNDPDPVDVGAGAEPPPWDGIPGLAGGDPYATGRYDVAALLITVVGAIDAVELVFARGSAGGNVVF